MNSFQAQALEDTFKVFIRCNARDHCNGCPANIGDACEVTAMAHRLYAIANEMETKETVEEYIFSED